MQVIGQFAVAIHPFAVLGAQHELLVEAVAVGCTVVGIGDVVDGYRFRAVLLADPVGIGQVDADRRCGIAVAAEHRHGDDLGRDPLDLLLAVGRIDGRMVLEPLGVRRDDLRAVAGRRIDEIDVGLPRSLVTERVAVGLDEAIDEIDVRNRVAHPADVVAVELLQVAALIIGDQGGDVLLLRALGHRLGLLEPVDHALDRRRIHAADAPCTLAERPVAGSFTSCEFRP